MPIYEYQCASCGQQIEVIQSFSDAPLTVCEHCGQPSLHKQISATSFHLKGEGWYVTDYRDKNKAKKTSSVENETNNKAETEVKKTGNEASSSPSTTSTTSSTSDKSSEGK